MQGFNHYVNQYKKAFNACAELAKYNCVELLPTVNKIGEITNLMFDIHRDPRLSETGRDILKSISNTADLIEIYLMTRIIKEGPKIFRPTQIDFEALEHMTININAIDYVQPFDTLVIELPENYCKNKIIELPKSQQNLEYKGDLLPLKHQPTMSIINYKRLNDKIIISASVMFDSSLSIKTSLVMDNVDTIEDYVDKIDFSKEKDNNNKNRGTGYQYKNTLDMSEEEIKTYNDCLRSSLNYCLLLDEIGIKKIGPSNPGYYNRLINRRNENKKNKPIDELNREIKLHPMIYEIDRHVRLYKTVNHSDDLPNQNNDNDKIVVCPHHRKGHYRMQPYGPSNGLRKRIRIPAVFVNAHLFGGEMINAKSTYED